MSGEPLSKDELQAMLDASPFIKFCGLECLAADPEAGTVEMRAPLRPEFERGAGSGQWHGGPIASIIDTVGDFALIMTLGRGLPTVNFRVDYLRPAIDTALIARAVVRRAGRTVGVSDVDVFNEKGALVAIGRGTYATVSPK